MQATCTELQIAIRWKQWHYDVLRPWQNKLHVPGLTGSQYPPSHVFDTHSFAKSRRQRELEIPAKHSSEPQLSGRLARNAVCCPFPVSDHHYASPRHPCLLRGMSLAPDIPLLRFQTPVPRPATRRWGQVAVAHHHPTPLIIRFTAVLHASCQIVWSTSPSPAQKGLSLSDFLLGLGSRACLGSLLLLLGSLPLLLKSS